MRFLVFKDLAPKGIRYSKVHVKRLVKSGKFPPTVKGLGNEDCWREDDVDQYINAQVAEARADEPTA